MKFAAPSPCRTNDAILLVQSYRAGAMTGQVMHSRLPCPRPFQSLPQLLLLLEELLERQEGLVHSQALEPPDPEAAGRIATLRIQVLFREHYSWQGRIVWEEKRKEAVFRSVLELIRILDEILAE